MPKVKAEKKSRQHQDVQKQGMKSQLVSIRQFFVPSCIIAHVTRGTRIAGMVVTCVNIRPIHFSRYRATGLDHSDRSSGGWRDGMQF